MMKKEFIQFFRNKSNIIILFVFPILLITCLGFALKDVVGEGSSDIFNDIKVLYNVEETSSYSGAFHSFMKDVNNNLDISFQSINNTEEAKEKVDSGYAVAFITISNKGYDYYRTKNRETIEGKVFRNVFEQFLDNYALIGMEKNHSFIDNKSFENYNDSTITEDSIGLIGINSFEYYTFAELALIMLYVSKSIAETVYDEKYLSTINRIRISKANSFQLIISKAFVGVTIGVLQSIEVYIYSSIVLKTNWGENIWLMFAILTCLSVFTSILGIVIGLATKDGKSMNSILNIIIISLCMFGGCYFPISMLKSMPIMKDIIVFTPLYWINSALISVSSGIKNNYAAISIALSLGLSIILVLGYIAERWLKRRKIIG